MNKLYRFSNENLTSYQDLYDFKNKKVLSVIGSGDQYFSSILYGAEEVTCFDMFAPSKYYLIFKYIAIKVLTYEEFVEFFIKSNMKNKVIYQKLRKHLPKDVKTFFDFAYRRGLNKLTYIVIGFNNKVNTMSGRVIPYLDKNNYNVLKELLHIKPLPNFIIGVFPNILNEITNDYDLILLSNIYSFLGIDVTKYNEIMKNVFTHLNETGEVQANYVWHEYSDFFTGFKENGYIIDKVDAVQDTNSYNYVATLRKKW